MNIGVFTSFDDNFKSVGDITYPILEKYCIKNNYHPHLTSKRISDRFPVWDKIKIIYDNLNFHDWLVYLDSDTLITNHTIKIESIIDDNYNFIAANDVHGFNSGVFFIKGKNEWSRKFLEYTWNIQPNDQVYHDWPCHNATQGEQRALKAAIRDNPESDKKVKLVSQKLFNCYLYNLYNRPETTEGNWQKGDFILHLPAVDNSKRVEIFTQKLQEIIYGD